MVRGECRRNCITGLVPKCMQFVSGTQGMGMMPRIYFRMAL
jgi:hypothetical protein